MKTSITMMTLVALVPGSGAAQVLTAPAPRQGYYVAAGPQGVSVSSKDGDLGRLSMTPGGAFSLRVGQMVSNWFGFGLQVEVGQAQNHRWTQAFGGLSLDAQVVPWHNLAVHAGGGIGFVYTKDKKDRIDGALGTGGAFYTAGIRYDFFPFYRTGSGGLAITPGVQVKYLPGDSFNSTMVWVGIEGTFWAGLPKQELELAPEDAFVRD